MTNLTLDPQVEPTSIRGIGKRSTPFWKRTLDIVLVLISLPVLTPLLVLVAGYIRMVSAGPIFFVQSRVGHGGEDFRIFKFRTMEVPKVSRDASHREYVANRSQVNEPLSKPDFKNELIRGGELIRKLSIDELPQIFNVLIGNMSLVGPRPDLLKLDDYEHGQTRRFEVLPGMTGLWQVSGKNSLSFDQMIDLDIEYVDTMSLKQDLKIIARTFSVLLFEHNE
jgi:lipopolysaccharide/colanic/teichoic acid biosynthesis glycosyltransferase